MEKIIRVKEKVKAAYSRFAVGIGKDKKGFYILVTGKGVIPIKDKMDGIRIVFRNTNYSKR